VVKAIVSYFILVRPLMLPSIAIDQMDFSKTYKGEIRDITEMTKAFRVTRQLFDQKIVTSLALSTDATANNLESSRVSAVTAAYES
jgi:hypothetical protein